MSDLPRTGYHKCGKMPRKEFVEKQQLGWHIHRTDEKHSTYRVDLKDGICPYCHQNLQEATP